MTDSRKHQRDEDMRPRTNWVSYVVLLLFIVLAIFIALFFLRYSLRDFPSDAAYSVSNAPSP